MCSDSVYNTNNSNPSLNYVYLNGFYRQLVIETPLHVCPTVFISLIKQNITVHIKTEHHCTYQNRTSLYIPKQNITVHIKTEHHCTYQNRTSLYIPKQNITVHIKTEHHCTYQNKGVKNRLQ